jgi:hypothetical protein
VCSALPPPLSPPGFGLRLLVFRIPGFGFCFLVSGSRFGFGASDSSFEIQDSGMQPGFPILFTGWVPRLSDFGFGFQVLVSGFGYLVSGFGYEPGFRSGSSLGSGF